MIEKTAINTFPTQPCPVCSGDRFKSWRWSGLEACVCCGHVRKVLDRTEEPSDKIQRVYFDMQFALQEDLLTHFYERLNAKRRLRELSKILPTGLVLEVGVGRGLLLFTLKSAGYSVEGIDVSPQVCAAVQARYGLPLHCGTLESYAEVGSPGTYDSVIMCHVLEHIESLSPTLRAIRRLLRESGILYLAVPNLSAWNAYLPGWTGYEPYHVHYFGSVCLRQALESAGFEVLYERTFEPLSGWFNTIVRSVRRHSPALDASLNGPHRNSYQNGFMWVLYNVMRIGTGILLSPLRWFQSALGRGEELVLIARANGLLRIARDGA
jgi:SAM-dependent methyltransferase